MKPAAPDFTTLKDLLLRVAQQPTLQEILECIATGVCEDRPHAARTGVWLTQDSSPVSGDSSKEPGSQYLVLAASGRKRQGASKPKWRHAGGTFDRVPYSEPIVGSAAMQEVGSSARDPSEWPEGRPDWAKEEGLLSYATQPILFRGQLLGVIAIFADIAVPRRLFDEGNTWLRIFADHAAGAIANARALEEIDRLRQQLELENDYLREEVQEAHGFGEIIGNSLALKKALGQVELVAPTDAGVLIQGESGTGKELMARAIHSRSKRKDRTLIKVNCAAIPESLFESEFFGHTKGSFTGAVQDRRGRFELAHVGTIFLDEVGEIPLDLQAKLLRVLQEGAFERIGDESTRNIDVRVIAASNRDLTKEVKARRFREDLYYRISVFPIHVPPLRERKEDIPLLTEHLLKQACKRLGSAPPKLREKHIRQLQEYNWPGNIRELQNVVERAVITARGGRFFFDLPVEPTAKTSPTPAPPQEEGGEVFTEVELKRLQRSNMLAALKRANGKIFGPEGAAELLEINPTTMLSRMKTMKIRHPRGRR